MDLGGSITLDGFDSVEPGALVVVKKIVGTYAKKFSEKKEFKRLTVTLKGEFKVRADIDGSSAEEESNNIFFALTGALDKVKWK